MTQPYFLGLGEGPNLGRLTIHRRTFHWDHDEAIADPDNNVASLRTFFDRRIPGSFPSIGQECGSKSIGPVVSAKTAAAGFFTPVLVVFGHRHGCRGRNDELDEAFRFKYGLFVWWISV
jgi:hypothetical protein